MPRADPPIPEIREAIDVLGLPHGENDDATYWWIKAGTNVHIDLWPAYPQHVAAGYHWRILISTNTLGRAPEAWSVQFALPYLLVASLPGGLVEDPQTNARFTDADDYLAAHVGHLDHLPPAAESE